jgi:hypothetical protein
LPDTLVIQLYLGSAAKPFFLPLIPGSLPMPDYNDASQKFSSLLRQDLIVAQIGDRDSFEGIDKQEETC